jgi:outer membrane lipoprotein-sorting protein
MLLMLAVAAVSVSACATKRYPIASPLSATEAQLMTCRELAIEADRVESTRTQIINTAQTDWRSVAGFLGDWGIGNSMAKSEAEAALQNRLQTVRATQTQRGCAGPNEPSQAQSPTATMEPAPAAAATPQ